MIFSVKKGPEENTRKKEKKNTGVMVQIQYESAEHSPKYTDRCQFWANLGVGPLT